ncbi:MAG TPA: Arm DNA-binding domain-containing protein [Lutibacter sp.]
MENSFNLIFYIKKTKADASGKSMIYMRITVNGRRSELSIQRKVDILKWNNQAGKAKGYSEEVQKINQLIDTIQNKIYKIHHNFVEKNIPYSA